MDVGIHANMTDEGTWHVADALRAILEALSAQLRGDYGGMIEHLWIDLELIEAHAKADGSPRHPFRFQKRVSGRSHFGLQARPDNFNVGHFSVRPDFRVISTLPPDRVVPYVLSLIYSGTAILCSKRKKLGGFDADAFRSKFRGACKDLGYPCDA